jgi:sulfotransferase family protein
MITSMRLPDVITIGAQKCGTTSLHRYLSAHPEVGVSKFKETRFFAVGGDPTRGEIGNWHRGLEWYCAQFPADRRVWVESFGGLYTDYPRIDGVPERMRQVLPDPRFLYVVRDPIDRLVSHYVHNYCDAIENRPFDEALRDLEGSLYVNRSLFFFQLEQYLKWFDRDRFLIIEHDALLHDRRATMAAIFRFLGVAEDFVSPGFDVIHHPSTQKRRNTSLGLWLQEKVGNHVFRHLKDHQRHWFRRIAYAPVSNPIPRPVVNRELRARLTKIFEPDVRRLEDVAARRFDWLKT